VLGQAVVWLNELSQLHSDLESVFLSLTEHDRMGGAQ